MPQATTRSSRLTAAEATDRHGRLLLIGISLFSLKYAMDAVVSLVDEPLAEPLDYVGSGLALAGLLAILPVMLWKFTRYSRLSPSERSRYFAPDSFVVDSMKQARKYSWGFSFILLVVLDVLSRSLTDLPNGFFLQVALSGMLGIFAATFFYLTRSTQGEAADHA